jgi:hypothetical protein
LAERLEGRRKVDALSDQAERLVGRLFRELKEPSRVVEALRKDQDLSPALHREAQRAIWRRLTSHNSSSR